MTPREILEEVKRRIVDDPKVYSQTTFCGTRCCIAGHIDVIVNGLDTHLEREKSTEWITAIQDIEMEALKALGFDENEHIWLFGTIDMDQDEPDENEVAEADYWPSDLGVEYSFAENAAERAAVGCKAIDRFIQERGL